MCLLSLDVTALRIQLLILDFLALNIILNVKKGWDLRLSEVNISFIGILFCSETYFKYYLLNIPYFSLKFQLHYIDFPN